MKKGFCYEKGNDRHGNLRIKTMVVENKHKGYQSAGTPVPIEGGSVKVVYNDDAPTKAEILY